MRILSLCIAALPGLALAAEPRRLSLAEAPQEIRQVIAAERSLRGSQVQELSITAADLNHDGQDEWLVSASWRDGAGFAQVNQPAWIFQQRGGRWSTLAFLGARVRVEVLPRPPGHDAIKALAKDGARLRCTLYTFRQGRYEPGACASLGLGP